MTHTVAEVMSTEIVALNRHQTALDAAKLMRSNNVGDVLVIDDVNRLAGVVTDRDLVVRVLAERKDPAETPLTEVASHRLFMIGADQPVAAAVELMRSRAIRRLPVVSENQLVGVVSLGDLASDQDPASLLAEISQAPPNH